MDLALNNLQRLICHKTQQTKPNQTKQKVSANQGIKFREIKISKVVEGDPKAPFSIATTHRCRGGRYSFPWIAPLYPWYVHYIAEC